MTPRTTGVSTARQSSKSKKCLRRKIRRGSKLLLKTANNLYQNCGLQTYIVLFDGKQHISYSSQNEHWPPTPEQITNHYPLSWILGPHDFSDPNIPSKIFKSNMLRDKEILKSQRMPDSGVENIFDTSASADIPEQMQEDTEVESRNKSLSILPDPQQEGGDVSRNYEQYQASELRIPEPESNCAAAKSYHEPDLEHIPLPPCLNRSQPDVGNSYAQPYANAYRLELNQVHGEFYQKACRPTSENENPLEASCASVNAQALHATVPPHKPEATSYFGNKAAHDTWQVPHGHQSHSSEYSEAKSRQDVTTRSQLVTSVDMSIQKAQNAKTNRELAFGLLPQPTQNQNSE